MIFEIRVDLDAEHLLEGDAFRTVVGGDQSAADEAAGFEQVQHRRVVAVSVYADVVDLGFAKTEHGVEDALRLAVRGVSVDGSVGLIIQPIPLADLRVRRIVPDNKRERPDDDIILRDHIPDPVLDILPQPLDGRMRRPPLRRVAVPPHKFARVVVDGEDFLIVFRGGVADVHAGNYKRSEELGVRSEEFLERPETGDRITLIGASSNIAASETLPRCSTL